MKTLVTREVADLIPYARNARSHGEAQVAQIAASINEFGFTNPVLIDQQNTIIAGYGRVLAAKTLKMTKVPCVVLPHLSDAQKAAYAIADNKLALNAVWDDTALQAEFGRLADLQYDVNLTGFSEIEIAALLKDTVAGELEVSKLLKEVVVDVTDPPIDAALTPSGDKAPKPAAGVGVTEPEKDWKGMPEFVQPEAGPFRTISVHFKDQGSVDAFARLIGQDLTEKTKWVWYPEIVKAAAAQVYA